MVLCKFYQQGRCKYGDECRYSHSNNGTYYDSGTPHKVVGDRYHYVRPQQGQDSTAVPRTEPKPINQILEVVNQDMIVAHKGGQWPLSCYGPVRDLGNIAGLDEVSPEELRCQMYIARQEGNIDECKRQIQELIQNAQSKINVLSSPSTEAYSILESLYQQNNAIPSAGFGPSNPSTFGSGAVANYSANIFGGSSEQSSLFGSSQQPPAGLFGSAAAAISTAMPGGFSPSPHITGSFGSAPLTSINPGNLFTATPSGFSSIQSPGGFSSIQSPGIFSSVQQPASGFSSVQPPNGLFGSVALNTTGSLFTPTPSSFPVPPSGLFSSVPSNTSTTGNIFNQTPNVSSVQPPSGLFSSAVTNQAGFFGANQATSHFETTTPKPSLLGPGPVLGTPTQVTGVKDSSVYTLLSDLSKEVEAAFRAETFTVGLVPRQPPPRELCC